MNPASPCSGCGSALDADQRYCVECGTRVGAPLALPYAAAAAGGAAAASGGAAAAAAAGTGGGFLSALPMPMQAAATCAALALGLGVVAGTALNPNLAGSLAGQTVVVEAPPAPEPVAPAPAPVATAAVPSPSVAAAPAPATTFSEDTGTTTTGGGGGGGGKKQKEKPDFVSGVVVHQNTVASSYSVAPGSGGVSVIHTSKGLPAPGTQVKVPVRELANLTSAEDGKRQATGQATTASFSGIVTYNRDSADPAVRDVYTLSNRASSFLIHSPADASPGTVAKPPPVGTVLRVTVSISPTIVETPTPPAAPPAGEPPVAPTTPPAPSCAAPATPFPNPPVFPPKSLYETAQAVEAPAADVDGSELESVVQAVCAGTGQILLAGDDVREADRPGDGVPDPSADLFDPTTGTVLTAGPGVVLSGFTPGQAVMANVTFAEDTDPATPAGTKIPTVITGIRGDTGISGADAATGQGDLAP